jgi:hypothetical protein
VDVFFGRGDSPGLRPSGGGTCASSGSYRHRGQSREPAIPGLKDAGFLTNETVFNLGASAASRGDRGRPVGARWTFARFGSRLTPPFAATSRRTRTRRNAFAGVDSGRVHIELLIERVEVGRGKVITWASVGKASRQTRFWSASVGAERGGPDLEASA